ncbi:hypothetical protein RSAG8_08411, partial [Rhizoctonia solani AG-8 WAC10335]
MSSPKSAPPSTSEPCALTFDSTLPAAQSGSPVVLSQYYFIGEGGTKFMRYAPIDRNHLPATVCNLPKTISGPYRRFWTSRFDLFSNILGKRGKRDSGNNNARNWVFKIFVTHFCEYFYPELGPEERCQYEAVLGGVSDLHILVSSRKAWGYAIVKMAGFLRRRIAFRLRFRESPNDSVFVDHS